MKDRLVSLRPHGAFDERQGIRLVVDDDEDRRPGHQFWAGPPCTDMCYGSYRRCAGQRYRPLSDRAQGAHFCRCSSYKAKNLRYFRGRRTTMCVVLVRLIPRPGPGRTGAMLQPEDRLREFAARAEEAREEERRHLARTLHDELGQLFSSIRLELGAAIAAFR
ncbi:MAG: histidine kinase, partial [Myxococcales bacterium]